MPPVGYVAYIDEAGDDGLYRSLRPDDPNGASEWMVMSAIVVKAENDAATVTWLREIIDELDQHQVSHLHFRRLTEAKKSAVCARLAGYPLRCFTVMSHKQNMRNYRNISAEMARVNRTAWFFCWLSRLLLERVTAYCAHRAAKDHGGPRVVRIEFSDRGGVKIDDIKAYYRYLREQSRMGMLYIDRFDLAWSALDVQHLVVHPNRMRAGLQLADIASSAFFQAVERTQSGLTRPQPAKLLLPRVCQRPTRHGGRYGYGLKIMPTWIPKSLPLDQREILDFYLAR